jgi:hypothetical protein
MRPKECDDTPRESRQQWTSLDEGKGEIKKQPPHHLHGHPACALVTLYEVCFLCEEKDCGVCIIPQVFTVHALFVVICD